MLSSIALPSSPFVSLLGVKAEDEGWTEEKKERNWLMGVLWGGVFWTRKEWFLYIVLLPRTPRTPVWFHPAISHDVPITLPTYSPKKHSCFFDLVIKRYRISKSVLLMNPKHSIRKCERYNNFFYRIRIKFSGKFEQNIN